MRRYPVAVVLFTVFVDLLGFGIVLPILPFYAQRYGASPVQIGAIIAAFSLMQFLFTPLWGRVSDHVGRRPVILTGWVTYALTMGALAFAQTPASLWTFGLALGLYFGLSEGAERALVRDLAAADERGTAFGWYHMLVGLAAIPAGVALGALWAYAGAHVAFLTSAACAAAACVAFAYYVCTE